MMAYLRDTNEKDEFRQLFMNKEIQTFNHKSISTVQDLSQAFLCVFLS